MVERVTVTGAGGYIGRHVVQGLIARGIAVTAVSRHRDPWLVERLGAGGVVESDVFTPTSSDWDRIVDADALIHLAWRDGFVLRSRAHGADLSRHYDFLTAAAEGGVRRLAVLGTMHEVGYWEGAVGPETPCRPTTEYGIAKDALRRLLDASLASAESTLAWLRCYYIVGDDERSSSIFSKILQAEARGDARFPFTTGTNLYDFIDVDQLADRLIAATLSDATGVVDCGTGQPMSLAAAVERFIAERGLSIELEYGAFPDRPFDSPGIWADATRIDEILAREAPHTARHEETNERQG